MVQVSSPENVTVRVHSLSLLFVSPRSEDRHVPACSRLLPACSRLLPLAPGMLPLAPGMFPLAHACSRLLPLAPGGGSWPDTPTPRHSPTPPTLRHSDTPTPSTLLTLDAGLHCQGAPTQPDKSPTLASTEPDTPTPVSTDTGPTLARHRPTLPDTVDTPTHQGSNWELRGMHGLDLSTLVSPPPATVVRQ